MIRDCADVPVHMKGGARIEHMKHLANKTHKILPASGIYMRH
jgi:hypothetical protein